MLVNIILPGACSVWTLPPGRTSPTWEVAAASSRAAPHPAALVHGHGPGLELVGLQGIGCEVADLQLCEMVDEIVIGHPERLEEERDPYGGKSKPPRLTQFNKIVQLSLVTVPDRTLSSPF